MEFQDVLNQMVEFQDVLNQNNALPTPIHGVHHHHEMTGHTITALFCHLDPEKLEVAKADFAKLETDDIV